MSFLDGRILVTGGAGFIGSHMVDLLLERVHLPRREQSGQHGPVDPVDRLVLHDQGARRDLILATADGLVCWLHDGWDDAGAEIASELVTRGYFGGKRVLALKGALVLETFRPEPG